MCATQGWQQRFRCESEFELNNFLSHYFSICIRTFVSVAIGIGIIIAVGIEKRGLVWSAITAVTNLRHCQGFLVLILRVFLRGM